MRKTRYIQLPTKDFDEDSVDVARLLEDEFTRYANKDSSGHGSRIPVPRNELSEQYGFVSTNWFLSLTGVILGLNTVMMLCSASAGIHHSLAWWFIDQMVLMFYVFELWARTMRFQWNLLFVYSTSEVLLNWLDLLVVISGIIDQWLYALLGNVARVVFYARIFRVARLLKWLRVLIEADTSWAEGSRFQSAIGGVIVFNALTMGLETDIHWAGFYWINQTLLLTFAFELGVQLKLHGIAHFSLETEGFLWYWLDAVIVSGGMLDQWLLPTMKRINVQDNTETTEVATPQASVLTQVTMVMRMMRLLRILRLLKLVKSVRPLYTLAQGILQAMQGMFWVLVLTIVVLYAFGIVTTRLIGHGLLFGASSDDASSQDLRDAMDLFANVPQSMFQLFQIMNGNTTGLDYLFDRGPFFRAAYVLYTIMSSWALLSILTAVLSDTMITVNANEKAIQDVVERENNRIRLKEDLLQLFGPNDTNGNSAITEEEMMSYVWYNHNDLAHATGLSVVDMRAAFEILQTEKDEMVTRENYVESLLADGRPLTTRQMMRFERRLRQLEKGLEDLCLRQRDHTQAILTLIAIADRDRCAALEPDRQMEPSSPDRRPVATSSWLL